MNDAYYSARMEMVERQIAGRGITDEKVIAAMKKVPRHLFVGKMLRSRAYSDSALPIEANQTISQPYMVALMTQSLQLSGDEKVLEIGTGSGYQAVILAEIARKVFTIDRVPELAIKARTLIETLGYQNIVITTGDGTLGLSEFAPFDRIIVTAATPEIPKELLKQLTDSGIMVVPVGDRNIQTLKIIQKEGEEFSVCDSINCVFVPLIGKNGWKK